MSFIHFIFVKLSKLRQGVNQNLRKIVTFIHPCIYHIFSDLLTLERTLHIWLLFTSPPTSICVCLTSTCSMTINIKDIYIYLLQHRSNLLIDESSLIIYDEHLEICEKSPQ